MFGDKMSDGRLLWKKISSFFLKPGVLNWQVKNSCGTFLSSNLKFSTKWLAR